MTRLVHFALIVALLSVGCSSQQEVVTEGDAPIDVQTPAPEPTPAAAESRPTNSTPTVTEPKPDPGAGVPDEATLDAMTLHLPDAPEGSRIGDDSGCGTGFSTDGQDYAFLEIVGDPQGDLAGCHIQLESPGAFIDSLVIAFPSDEAAVLAIEPGVFESISRYHGLGCCANETVGPIAVSTVAGVAQVEATSPTDDLAVVGWRTGSLIGAVSVHTAGSEGALAEAQRLAAIQDERMRNPIPIPADIDDDRLVGLDTAPFRTWWLGETFSPPGLPAVELYTTNYGGGLVELDYSGIRIEIFDLDAVDEGSEPDEIRGVADELFDSPCTVTVAIDHPDGEASLLGRPVPAEFFELAPGEFHEGWGVLNDDTCPDGEPTVWMATIDYGDGTLVRVNAPICYNCLAPPDVERPYSDPAGLEAVIKGLIPYTAP